MHTYETATSKTLVAITSGSQISGVSRISARGVLKVRSDTKSGGGRGAVIRKAGGGGGAVIRKAGGGGGGCCRFLARYEKGVGGGQARILNVLRS